MAITIIFRTPQALGFPVVPLVYISAVRSPTDLFAAANPVGLDWASSELVTSSVVPVGIPSKEDKFSAICGRSERTNSDISGVEIMNFERETLRQCMKVSSAKACQYSHYG